MAVGKPQKDPGIWVSSPMSRRPTAHGLKPGVGAEGCWSRVREWQWFFMRLKENREKSLIENKQAPCQNKEQFSKKGKIGKTVKFCFQYEVIDFSTISA